MTRETTARRWSVVPRITVALAIALVLPRVSDGEDAVPGPVSVSVRTEPDTVGVGASFRYIVQVAATQDVELVLPLLVDQVGDFLIRDYGEIAPEAGSGVISERWYELVPYSVGDQLIAGGEIAYRVAGGELQALAVPEAVISVESLLAGAGDSAVLDIRDIEGPIGVARDYSPWWMLGIGGVLLVAMVAGLLLWLRRHDAAAAAKPERPAHEIALEELKRLRRTRLLEDGRQPEYYVRLSGIVRAYIERRFRVRAAEMTTEEFLQAAQANRDLAAENRARLGEFLGEADLVKFARHVPSVDQGERAFAAARDFVTETAAAATEASADAGEANDAAA